ncbi:hypothetical protein CMUS01_06838 [Colletotrichum musicola]|uniref:Uncharacterized protein n=1 Tax=Colletotrichum musicola TaxID=2175873 RepID=A0A8H6KKL3_9PEZI|nr:hypothetical protein CMUS01_06838 [Colletotrichum musicola]
MGTYRAKHRRCTGRPIGGSGHDEYLHHGIPLAWVRSQREEVMQAIARQLSRENGEVRKELELADVSCAFLGQSHDLWNAAASDTVADFYLTTFKSRTLTPSCNGTALLCFRSSQMQESAEPSSRDASHFEITYSYSQPTSPWPLFPALPSPTPSTGTPIISTRPFDPPNIQIVRQLTLQLRRPMLMITQDTAPKCLEEQASLPPERSSTHVRASQPPPAHRTAVTDGNDLTCSRPASPADSLDLHLRIFPRPAPACPSTTRAEWH